MKRKFGFIAVLVVFATGKLLSQLYLRQQMRDELDPVVRVVQQRKDGESGFVVRHNVEPGTNRDLTTITTVGVYGRAALIWACSDHEPRIFLAAERFVFKERGYYVRKRFGTTAREETFWPIWGISKSKSVGTITVPVEEATAFTKEALGIGILELRARSEINDDSVEDTFDVVTLSNSLQALPCWTGKVQ